MKKKILLFSLILISILFINIGKVSAEEYQVGDLVEVINPSGGESQQFYVVLEDDGYILESKDVIVNSPVSNEEINYEYIPQYLKDLENTLKEQKYIFLQGFEFWGIDALLDDDSIENIDEKGINVNFPSFMKNYDDVFITSNVSGDTASVLFMRQVNGSFVVKQLTANSFQELDNKIGGNLNFYLNLYISKENSNIMRKVELPQSQNTNEMQTTTINDKQHIVSNPKTSDINILLVGAGILLVGFGIILGLKKIQKLSK